MKPSVLISFLIVASSANSQIDYRYFTKAWCKCLPESGESSDTLTFMDLDLKDKCKTTRTGEDIIQHQNLHYTFFANDSMTIYRDSGYTLRPDYVPDSMATTATRRDTIVDSHGGITIVVKEDVMMVPVSIAPGGSAASFSQSFYKLDKETNSLMVIDDGQIYYEILALSEKEMVLRLTDKR